MEFENLQNILYEKNQFIRYNHIRPVEADLEHAVMVHEISETSLNPYNIVHGGVYFSMQDVAAGTLARMDGRRYVTLDSSNHFLKAATGGTLTATASVVHRGRTVCTIRTEVRDDKGALLSDGTFSMFCLEPEKPMDRD